MRQPCALGRILQARTQCGHLVPGATIWGFRPRHSGTSAPSGWLPESFAIGGPLTQQTYSAFSRTTKSGLR